MSRKIGPLLTRQVAELLLGARDAGAGEWHGSLDLGLSIGVVALHPDRWEWNAQSYPYPPKLKDRTIYWLDGTTLDGTTLDVTYAPVARFNGALIKLVPTDWGAPTFEIDGIKMLPTAKVSPFEDARHKVALVEPHGKIVLDTCGGLGYFAACCLAAGAAVIHSFEKNADVLWLRTLNPWSPDPDASANAGRLRLVHADVTQAIAQFADGSIDVVLHDPPRFGIAGELYSRAFYDQLARVLRRGGRMFHYTGSPNKLGSGRDVPREVAKRLEQADFNTRLALDGVLATRR